jgi:hypothetical protein
VETKDAQGIMSTSSIPSDRGDRRSAHRDPAERGTFARRIECDGAPRDARLAPARGGGYRELEAWTRRREARS